MPQSPKIQILRWRSRICRRRTRVWAGRPGAVGFPEVGGTERCIAAAGKIHHPCEPFQKAIEAYQTLASGSPGDTDLLFELAGLYESAGDLDKARAELAKVESLDPKRTEALLVRGRVEPKSNNPEKGLEFLSTALNLSIQVNNEEQRADILHAMGVGYAYMHRNDETLRSLEESLAIKQRLGLKAGAAASLDEMATLESGQGKSDEALKNFNEALKPRRKVGDKAGAGDVLTDLDTFYVDRGKPEQALALFKKSLQIQI